MIRTEQDESILNSWIWSVVTRCWCWYIDRVHFHFLSHCWEESLKVRWRNSSNQNSISLSFFPLIGRGWHNHRVNRMQRLNNQYRGNSSRKVYSQKIVSLSPPSSLSRSPWIDARSSAVGPMMYGFGDDYNSAPDTIALMEELVIDHITDIVHLSSSLPLSLPTRLTHIRMITVHASIKDLFQSR